MGMQMDTALYGSTMLGYYMNLHDALYDAVCKIHMKQLEPMGHLQLSTYCGPWLLSAFSTPKDMSLLATTTPV